jgi:hypothetical protein
MPYFISIEALTVSLNKLRLAEPFSFQSPARGVLNIKWLPSEFEFETPAVNKPKFLADMLRQYRSHKRKKLLLWIGF